MEHTAIKATTLSDLTDVGLAWQEAGAVSPQPPPRWQAWLLTPDSLTRQLKIASAGDFQVEVLAETWLQPIHAQLRACFGPLRSDHRFWSRQVQLLGRGEVWVQAHTLIPVYSLQGSLASLKRLGDRPLGEYLFEQPELRRSAIELCQQSTTCWGRRSVFYLSGHPIMVAEFFLSTLVDQYQPQTDLG